MDFLQVGDIMSLICHMTSQDRHSDVCPQPVKCGSLRYSGSAYIFSFCHKTSLDHMINGLSKFMGGSLSG